MGSPVSPILAVIVMEDLEKTVLDSWDFIVPTYYRYVDDIFLIIPHDKVEHILSTFTSYHPRLQFTHEIEHNRAISFFILELIKDENNNIMTNWFRKKAYSGRLLDFYSNHSLQHEIGILKIKQKNRKLLDNVITNMTHKFEKNEIISLEFHGQISEIR